LKAYEEITVLQTVGTAVLDVVMAEKISYKQKNLELEQKSHINKES